MQALRNLYQTNLEKFALFVNCFPNEDLEGPLLLQPSAYFQQTKRLFIVGQETNGWHCAYDDVDAQLAEYVKFNMGETYRASPFWNLTRKIESVLGIESYSCAWSNLNRFDHGGHAPMGKILEEVSKLDFLLREEIQILKPDICLFYTNRKYDDRIKVLYPAIQIQNIEGLPAGHFACLTHPDLPTLTFRTPHPKTIRVQKWEDAFLTFMRSLSTNTVNA